MLRLSIIATTYFLCGTMEVMAGGLRGIGYSIIPMIVSLIGACAFRIFWIYTAFQEYRALETIYVSYPISWILTTGTHLIVFLYGYRKLLKE
jgi:Na+-driven multidrug efflux pump